MITICFVCTGNTCRSIMAERLFKQMLKERKISFIKVISRGLNSNKENISDYAKVVLKEYHANDRDRKAIKLGKVDNNTLYVTMTEYQKTKIKADRVISFKDIIGEDVADPYGMGIDQYRSCARQITKGLVQLLNKILRGVNR